MLDTPDYLVTDPGWVRALAQANPWMTLVGVRDGHPVATHMPVLVEEDDGQGLTLVTHLGIPDDEVLGIADGSEVLAVVEGVGGYVSPTWYAWGPAVPTWNYQAAHLRARAEILDADATWQVLEATIAAFEEDRAVPFRLSTHGPGGTDDLAYAHRIARGVRGLRLHVTSWEAKDKMSQDKPVEVVERIRRALRAQGDDALADAMGVANAARLEAAQAVQGDDRADGIDATDEGHA